MKISVIVPVYNGDKYIERFLNSLNRQSFDSFEVIFIDDGSKDGSAALLDKAADSASTFPISVFHQENAGQSAARNSGIKMATGEYIYFSDIDDEINDDSLEHLYKIASSGSYDLVIGNTSWIDGYGTETLVINTDTPDEVIQGRENVLKLLTEYADDPKSYRWFWTVWNKLYKASVIKEQSIYFDESMRAIEDIPYVISYMAQCSSIYITKKVMYRYYHFGRENYASAWHIKQPLLWKKEAAAFEKALKGCDVDDILAFNYCEYAIWTMFRLCLLSETLGNIDSELKNAIEIIVDDQDLQKNIHKYHQKHDDNDRRIPELIKAKDVDGIINAFYAQIRKRKAKLASE